MVFLIVRLFVITLVYKNICCIYWLFFNVISLCFSMFGDAREMELHYFLADDTVEICERIPNNSGRDAVPMFLRRQRLPKVNKYFNVVCFGISQCVHCLLFSHFCLHC